MKKILPATSLNAFFSWKPACWLRVQGPDAFAFLQGQFSNDLSRLMGSGGNVETVGVDGATLAESVYGLWLDRRGRILGDGLVLRASEECFFVCSYETPGAALHTHLEHFLVADEVEVFDETAAVVGLTLFAAEGELATMATARESGFVFAGRRGRAKTIEWVGAADVRAGLLRLLDQDAVLGVAEMERRRILGGIPAVPRDLGDRELPQEGGADFERAAVSYTKGCYLGQEVMSRLHTLGRVRRQLVFVRGCGAIPKLPAPLYLGEKQVGELRSAVAEVEGAGSAPETLGSFVGHALISLLSLPKEGGRLALSANGTGELMAEGLVAATSLVSDQ